MKYSLQHYIRWKSPIYINTLNIFKPFETLKKAKDILTNSKYKVKIKKGKVGDTAPIYTSYYWDGDFWKKNWLFHCLIEDVMWKSKYGMIEFEEPPRWHFVFFKKWYLTISLEFDNNYREYERILNFIQQYYG